MHKRLFAVASICIAVIVIAAFTWHPSSAAQSSTSSAQMTQGKYLVSAVAGCMDCHGANLHGAPLPFGPVAKLQFPPGVHWAKYAPNIVALIRTGSADKWARFLETGVDPNGGHANPPMPQFRMKPSDASAVISYIRSLR